MALPSAAGSVRVRGQLISEVDPSATPAWSLRTTEGSHSLESFISETGQAPRSWESQAGTPVPNWCYYGICLHCCGQTIQILLWVYSPHCHLRIFKVFLVPQEFDELSLLKVWVYVCFQWLQTSTWEAWIHRSRPTRRACWPERSGCPGRKIWMLCLPLLNSSHGGLFEVFSELQIFKSLKCRTI